MKTKLFINLFLLSVISANAQIPVGSWYTGGSIRFGYNTDNNGDSKRSDLSINPQTLYQINNHWAVGAGVFIATQMNKFKPNDTKNTNINYGIAPAVRYYGNISQTVNCYLQGNVIYAGGTTKTEVDSFETKTSSSTFGLSLIPGISWNIKKRVYLDFSYGNLSFLHSVSKQDGVTEKDAANSFNLSLSPNQISLGLYYTFGKIVE